MVIYVYYNGDWEYEWDYSPLYCNAAIRIDLDRLYEYKDLTPLQIKACEEALSE